MAKIRKKLSPSDLLSYVFSLLRISHLKFANIIAIVVCIVAVWFLNSENEAARLLNYIAFEWNAGVQKLFNKPYEISNKAKELVDEALYLNQIRELQDRNKVLSERIISLEIDNKEIPKLKQLLDFKVSGSYTSVTTRIIRASLNESNQNMLIMLGKEDGIDEKSFVVDGESLVGKITDVGSDTAEVMLITNINSRTPVVFVNSGIKGVVSGEGYNKDLRVSYLSSTQEPEEGDHVVTSGDGSIYPHGIIVGTLHKKDSEWLVKATFNTKQLDLVKAYKKKKAA